jgi:valyl-tRNA synthetase
MNMPGGSGPAGIPEKVDSLAHRWILSRLRQVSLEADESLDQYHFNQYAHALYHFLWHEYCDWYLEMAKSDFYGEDPHRKAVAQSVAVHVLERILLLLHPVMPFVTEEIWQQLPQTAGSIMEASLPDPDPRWRDDDAEAKMDLLMGVVNGIRNVRGEMNVPPATRVEVVCLCEEDASRAILEEYASTVVDLARLAGLKVGLAGEIRKPRMAASTVTRRVEVFVVLEGILDFESEARRLEKELSRVEHEVGITQRKLSNEDFLGRAPQEVVEKEREKGARLAEKLEKLRGHYERLKTLGK